MSKNVLIAGLGDHPTVVTAMVKALRESAHIEVDIVYVLHPEKTGKDIAQLGYPLIEEHLQGQCEVHSVPLPFADPNTREKSFEFLRTLTGLMIQYQDEDTHNVYFSLAGGRKNMSALMALVTQFFPSVKGLYHLIDKQEESRSPAFLSIEELLEKMPDIQDELDPPLDQLNLVPVPYPGAFAEASKLWEFLKKPNPKQGTPPIPLTAEAEAFFRAVFQPGRIEQQLDVWLSETAYNRCQELVEQRSTYAVDFLECFKQMRDPNFLKDRVHGTFGEFHFYKRRRTSIRPFYYTTPNPIHLYPQKQVEQVIICGLSIEQDNGQYDLTAEHLLATAAREPYKSLSDLSGAEQILVVPLGKTPMLATQTYTLLRQRKIRIPTVAIIYPEHHSLINNGVHLLKHQFKRKNVEFLTYPVKGIKDVDSEAACKTYSQTLMDTIKQLGQQYPDRQIALSLSGGRKGMSALTLFAAQYAGINQLYHTLITDIDLEKRVEHETNLGALKKLPSDTERARHLFLDAYEQGLFELFTIPVIATAHT